MIHGEKYRYFCDLCDYKAYFKAHITAHTNYVHKGIARNRNLNCKKCESVFKNEEDFLRHDLLIHKQWATETEESHIM